MPPPFAQKLIEDVAVALEKCAAIQFGDLPEWDTLNEAQRDAWRDLAAAAIPVVLAWKAH